MSPDAGFQARVTAAIVRLEDDRGGAVCPLRRVPLDLIALEVARDLGVGPAGFDALRFVPDGTVTATVAALVARYLGGPDARPPNTSTLSLTGDPIGPLGP